MESLIERLGTRNKGVVLPCQYRPDADETSSTVMKD